jgi:phosphate transport system ATP-binding protein
MQTGINNGIRTTVGRQLPRMKSATAARATDVPKVDRTMSQSQSATEPAAPPPLKAEVKSLSFYYGHFQALKNVNLQVAERKVTALIGPSGCGKSTLLRCFNRIHDLYPGNRYEGEITLHPSGANIVSRSVDPIEMRMRIGMVFQKPNPFPKSIFENIAYGLRLRGMRNRSELADRVEAALKSAAIWEEVKNRLGNSAYDLSGGQQQRICIARALATDPEILLFDEPTSALDPVATNHIEELIGSLESRVTIIIVTHNMSQAARISAYTGFMYVGEIIEIGKTVDVFENPTNKLTEEYITGRFG